MKDDFGDRMKLYEGEAEDILLPLLPVMARLDGSSFSKWTKGLKRPYDERLSKLMIETTRELLVQTGAIIGYTQSDEISLAWHSEDFSKTMWHGGRKQKIASRLAAICTAVFNYLLPKYLPEKDPRQQLLEDGEPVYEKAALKRLPTFDARVWTVPNKTEGANTFLWREKDATRNSISMAARSVCSHKQLHGKSSSEMQEMLHQAGINWNDYPEFFKRGTYIRKEVVVRPYTPDEIEKLPEKHSARTNPDLKISRVTYRNLKMPPFMKVKNREGVVFDAEEPQTENAA